MDYTIEELVPIVKEVSEKYTGKQSTSVTYEVAEQLMEAVIYCIDENKFSNDCSMEDEQLSTLEKMTAKTAYQTGYERVLKKAEESKKIYEEILLNFHAYGNQSYHDTIIEGMPNFFLYYDPKFNPQNHILTLDYQVIKPLGKLCGVDAIYQYLRSVQLEQKLLAPFPREHVKEVLSWHHGNYKDLFINICGLILRNVLCHMIVGKKITERRFDHSQLQVLKEFIVNNSHDELSVKLANMLNSLVEEGYGGDELLLEYLKEEIPNIATELINSAQNDCLEAVGAY